jgi:hypothetical protein
MKLYTLLTSHTPAALQTFAQTAKALGATGVTVLTRPSLVAYTPPLDTPTPQTFQQQADAAAARKDYKAAAEFQAKADNAAQDLRDMAAQGAAWVKEALAPVKEITQLVVLGDLHWPTGTPWTAQDFFGKVATISEVLTTTGIGGIVQKTPLLERTYVPLLTAQVAGGPATQGEPAGASGLAVETPARHPADHPSIPRNLSPKQSEYVAKRLGLDRGGARRSKNEAGNLMGWSPHISAKIENEIIRSWPEFEAKVNENTPEPEPALA